MIEILLVNESYTRSLYTPIVAAVDEVCAIANIPCIIRRVSWNEHMKADLTRAGLLNPKCLVLLGSFDKGLTEHLSREQLPWVALANGMQGKLAADSPNFVYFDERDCLAKAVSYLLYLEHTSIALLADVSSAWERRLVEAYIERMQLEGLGEQLISLCVEVDPYLGGRAAVAQLNRIEPRPTALLIAGSEAAAGLARAWNQQHASIKQTTSLFLLSGVSAANDSPGYSCIAIPVQELGMQLASMALHRHSAPDSDAESIFVVGRFTEGHTCWPLALSGMF